MLIFRNPALWRKGIRLYQVSNAWSSDTSNLWDDRSHCERLSGSFGLEKSCFVNSSQLKCRWGKDDHKAGDITQMMSTMKVDGMYQFPVYQQSYMVIYLYFDWHCQIILILETLQPQNGPVQYYYPMAQQYYPPTTQPWWVLLWP